MKLYNLHYTLPMQNKLNYQTILYTQPRAIKFVILDISADTDNLYVIVYIYIYIYIYTYIYIGILLGCAEYICTYVTYLHWFPYNISTRIYTVFMYSCISPPHVITHVVHDVNLSNIFNIILLA